MLRAPRLTSFAVIALILTLVIAILAPHQLGVTLYKLSLVSLAAVLGYWIDRVVFPYARPHEFFHIADWLRQGNNAEGSRAVRHCAGTATLRRAIVMAAVIIAIALGA
ncbi:putative holin [Marinobacterium litorale]|uniref:putative holin n=1 Tax=Marinobacterium litorale TaxID=404770 RepID=UPI00042626FD|nr:putative holin [Marinobacterium litorale]